MRSRRLIVTFIALIAVLAIVATTIGYFEVFRSGPAPSEEAGVTQVNAQDAHSYYTQSVTWGRCASGTFTSYRGVDSSDPREYQCAFLKAPLDWDNPGGEQIDLALAVRRSTSANAPALFINPGGPGGSIVNSLPYYAAMRLGQAVTDAYDIIAMDPRGVGTSTPVICSTDAQKDETRAASDSSLDESPQAGIEETREASAALAQGCQSHSGELFRHVDTVSAARDFDMARAVLGQEQLNFLGYSYGTFLGATYAGLYPERVGRFVLDGAIDPAIGLNELSALQMRGLDASLQQWVAQCVSQRSCPLGSSLNEGVARLVSFFDQLDATPMNTGDADRPLTVGLAFGALSGCMYNAAWWPQLTEAMRAAINNGDGSRLLALSDTLNQRGGDGRYADNSLDAINVINNLDFSPEGTPEQWEQQAATLRSELPILGRFAGYPSAAVQEWPTTHAARQAISAQGAAPILVIGTTHDPATPYVMAQSLTDQLSSGVLVSVEGWNHTAYQRDGDQCVVSTVENYLVRGTVPTSPVSCG